jgi:hypothetical protein
MRGSDADHHAHTLGMPCPVGGCRWPSPDWDAFYCKRCPWTRKHAHCQECDWPIAPGMTICGECGCEQDGE